ncbi:MAG: dihydroorotate dehydrogenase-like protein [Bacteroidales bacterium]|nr:dihydroorotate dehydrogenase-like protein [Bacteroidales bacterium]
MNTQTKYMGLNIESPVIVGSCGLTNSIDDLKKCEDAGAGAVILKSVFEEQIIFDIKHSASVYAPTDQYGGSYDYIAAHVAADAMDRHFTLICNAKEHLRIPIVGSINCYSFENWLSYAKRFQEAGCDALELNMAILPYETETSSDDVDRLFQNVIQTLKKTISIPISIKVSSYFTDMAKFMQQLSWTGISGITMFNKALNIDVDVESMNLTHAPSLSTPDEIYNTLRWVAILSNKLRCPISASTGVFSGNDVVKMLLAGAQTVQVVSCLYKNGIDYLKTINCELRTWMEQHNMESIDQFRGKLAVKPNEEASMFLRTQFMKYFAEIQ